MLSWIPTYPFDTIKTRIQNGSCKTYLEAIKMGNIWNGISVCSIRAFLVNSVGFWSYYKALDTIYL